MSTQPQVPWTIQTPPTNDQNGNNHNWRELKRIYEQVAKVINQFTASIVVGVSSVFGRTGAVVAQAGDYGVAQVTGAAPLASPTFTGTPAGPTAAPGTNTTQLATTAFVQAAVGTAARPFYEDLSGLVNGVTTVFTMPSGRSYNVVIVISDGFPLVLTTGYTLVGVTLTITAASGAPVTSLMVYGWL